MSKAEKPAGLVDELRAAVLASGLSLAEIERRCGVDHAAMSRFMRGERTLTLPAAAKVCAALGLHLCQQEGKAPAPWEPRKAGRPKGTGGKPPAGPAVRQRSRRKAPGQ